MKLISMTEFVLGIDDTFPEFRNYQTKYLELRNWKNLLTKIENYANFLSQPLELWMFTACNDDGNVYSEFPEDTFTTKLQLLEYKSAQERVLFTGFYTEWGFWPSSVSLLKIIGDTVEDAAGLSYIELTPTAIKQIL